MWSIGKDGYAKPLVLTDITEQYNQPRQNLPVVYWQNGYIDITRTKTIMVKNSMTGSLIWPLIVSASHLIDIDNELTFKMAEMLYQKMNKLAEVN